MDAMSEDNDDDGLVHRSDSWLSSMVSRSALPEMVDCDEDDGDVIHREELWRSIMGDDSPRSVLLSVDMYLYRNMLR
jgi:hypothetical protein